MNSFIENVNYLASLDNNYGDGIVLNKNNLSLRNVANDVTLKFSYFNYNTKQIETVDKIINGMFYTGLETVLQEFCAKIESSLGGNKFHASFTIYGHNISITINSLDEKLKCTEINFNAKITSTQVEIYNLYGDVINPLKLLSVLAMLEPEVVDAIPMVYENIDSIIHINSNTDLLNDIKNNIIPNINEILEADNNALIASRKALDASASALSALSSATTATTKESEALVSANNAATSATNASISETQSATSAGQSATSASSAANSAGDASASAIIASTQAGIAATKASDASVSANSASYSANTSSTKASEASASASNALDSENKAEKWASESEDVEVETGEYSAKHWALKSKELSARVALNISYDNTESGLSSSTTQDAIDELDNNLDNLSANVYTKSEINSSLATKAEVVVVDGKVDTHVAKNDNPHSVTKTQVGLSNVDNTSDTNKPISISAQNALNQKQNVLVSGTNIKTVNGVSVLGSGDISTVDSTKLPLAGGTMTGAITAIRETKVAMAANNIDLATGNLFTKTISGATTLTISNALADGNVNSFVLELTNGGSAVTTWFSGVKWAGGIAPTLTASGKDILGFYSHDGGTTWNILGINKDVK